MSSAGMEPTGGEGPSKAKIFISYSRRDLEFADRLDLGLKARGFETLIDRSEVYAFEDWWQRIETLIAQADTIVFVLSPDAVASDVCRREVEFAASLNKRLAPVVYRRVGDSAVPEALARLNFIFFDRDVLFDDSLNRLSEALETDIEWVRQHTAFGEQARRWSMAGRPGPRGLLLRSPMLEEAERWIASRPRGASAPTEDTQAYIMESRLAATRRRNIVTFSLAAGLLVALVLAGYAYWQRGVTVVQEKIAQEQRNRATLTVSRFLTTKAQEALDARQPELAELIARAALPADLSAPDGPIWYAALGTLVDARAADSSLAVLTGHTNGVNDIAWSPDGSRLATASDDHTGRVWDAKTGALLVTLTGHTGPVVSFAWSPDGSCLATASTDGTVRVWDAKTGAPLATLPAPYPSHLFRFVVPRGRTIPVVNVAWSPDGARLATASDHNTARVWDAKTGTPLATLTGHTDSVIYVAWSPDGSRLATASWDRTARVWDAGTGASLVTLTGHSDPVIKIAWSPDGGTRLATASDDHTARVWDAKTGAPLATLTGHTGPVVSFAWGPDGSRLATASDDHTGRVWDAKTGAPLATLTGHTDAVASVAWSPDGTRLATASEDDTGRVWDAKTGAPLVTLTGHTGYVMSVAWSPDGSRLATASWDHTARVWDAETGALLATLTGHTNSVGSVAWSSDGARLATASWDKTARVWDAKTGALLATMIGHTGEVVSVAWSPDGARLATASFDHTARVWDAKTGALLMTLTGHTETVFSVVWSPDGARLATASVDHTARVWDAETGGPLVTLTGHAGWVNDIAWSPDGSRLATASDDHTGRVWDAKTSAPLATLTGHTDTVFSVVWSPDGARLATASLDKTARVWVAWPLLSADTVVYADIAAFRDLTATERAALFLETPEDAAPINATPSAARDVAGMTVSQLQAAAAAGNPYANRRLAELYETGNGVQ